MRLTKIFSVAVSILPLVSCVTDSDPVNSGVAVGDSLPHFAVTLNNGHTLATDSLKGKISVITFFNTSCQDCRKELPEIDKLREAYSANPDIVTFAIARNESAESIAAYWSANNLHTPWSAQPDNAVYSLFATVGIPRIYISDRQGIIVAAYGDTDSPSFASLSLKIESLL